MDSDQIKRQDMIEEPLPADPREIEHLLSNAKINMYQKKLILDALQPKSDNNEVLNKLMSSQKKI